MTDTIPNTKWLLEYGMLKFQGDSALKQFILFSSLFFISLTKIHSDLPVLPLDGASRLRADVGPLGGQRLLDAVVEVLADLEGSGGWRGVGRRQLEGDIKRSS